MYANFGFRDDYGQLTKNAYINEKVKTEPKEVDQDIHKIRWIFGMVLHLDGGVDFYNGSKIYIILCRMWILSFHFNAYNCYSFYFSADDGCETCSIKQLQLIHKV